MEFNLYFWNIIFEADVVVLTIETIKLVFKPLDIFDAFEIREDKRLRKR